MEEEFLLEYEKLCQKYKMGLKGCGCCGSPFLNDICDINYNEKFNQIFIGGNGFWNEQKQEGKLEKGEEIYLDKTIKEYFLKE